jgi:hypothetical protein
MDADDGTGVLRAMLIGVGVALIVVVGLVFQDVVTRLVRWLLSGVMSRVPTPSRPRLFAEGQWGTFRVGQLLDRLGAGFRAVGSVRLTKKQHPIPPADPQANAEVEEPAPVEAPEVASSPELRRPRREELTPGSVRQYRPMSSLHVEDVVNTYLRDRAGRASVDAMVRHIDEQFGAGLGREVLEGLRNRGVVQIRRDPSRPTQLQVFLVGSISEGLPSD